MIFLKLGSWLASQKADKNVQLHSRSPHGERGLKSWRERDGRRGAGRSPHGERGLKFGVVASALPSAASLSSRRTWIEIARNRFRPCRKPRSLSSRRTWIEMLLITNSTYLDTSLSSRRTWIEIMLTGLNISAYKSLSSRRTWIEISCATRRSSRSSRRSPHGERGLKWRGRSQDGRRLRSLSSRRTWIEIDWQQHLRG